MQPAYFSGRPVHPTAVNPSHQFPAAASRNKLRSVSADNGHLQAARNNKIRNPSPAHMVRRDPLPPNLTQPLHSPTKRPSVIQHTTNNTLASTLIRSPEPKRDTNMRLLAPNCQITGPPICQRNSPSRSRSQEPKQAHTNYMEEPIIARLKVKAEQGQQSMSQTNDEPMDLSIKAPRNHTASLPLNLSKVDTDANGALNLSVKTPQASPAAKPATASATASATATAPTTPNQLQLAEDMAAAATLQANLLHPAFQMSAPGSSWAQPFIPGLHLPPYPGMLLSAAPSTVANTTSSSASLSVQQQQQQQHRQPTMNGTNSHSPSAAAAAAAAAAGLIPGHHLQAAALAMLPTQAQANPFFMFPNLFNPAQMSSGTHTSSSTQSKKH